jgi:hypothetical protein
MLGYFDENIEEVREIIRKSGLDGLEVHHWNGVLVMVVEFMEV